MTKTIAVVGSGGKTTLIHKLAKRYQNQKKRVLITTTTHMLEEENTMLIDPGVTTDKILKKILQRLETGLCMVGTKTIDSNGKPKIGSLPIKIYQQLSSKADVVLVEADGAAGRLIKYPAEYEPVIPENVDEILVCVGMSALGMELQKAAHRLELTTKCLQANPTDQLLPIHMQKLLQKGYLNPLRTAYPNIKVSIVPMGINNIYEATAAEFLREEIDIAAINPNWFQKRPRLVVCGGGHVALKTVQLAKMLDFYVTVIDERQEFANKTRFSMANQVYCRPFKQLQSCLSQYENTYYIIATNGHVADQICLETVLKQPRKYLGMIGSKNKVAHTFSLLKEKGYSKNQIDSIHAPIGLAIDAQTPAEIAVSIFAQIIKIKAGFQTSSITEELLQNQSSGVLCVIIEKKGSAPRGVGSMMLVTNDRCIGTIGGGAIEAQAIQYAKTTTKISTQNYNLSNEQSAKLGMVCGGGNIILFVPIRYAEF